MEIFSCVDRAYIESELRTDSGEIEAAESSELPDLVDDDDEVLDLLRR